jgi:diguanylate cyclase (GGDEF)-like protein
LKSHNLVFKNETALLKFIERHDIKKYPNIFVQIFSGIIDKEELLVVSQLLKKHLPNAHIIGTTTNGEIVGGEMIEKHIVISMTTFDSTRVKSAFYEIDEGFSVEKIAHDLIEDDTKALIVFSDGLQSNADNLLHEIYKLKPEMVIAGGRAGDNLHFKETYVFDEKNVSDNACVIASLSGDELIVNSDYMLNWTPIGKDMVITKVSENVLYELDGIPILEIYKKYLGEDILDNFLGVCMEFPLIVKRDGIVVARAPLLQREDNGLVFAGNFEHGDTVRFSFGNIEDIAQDSRNHFESFKRFPAESIFIYSCAARKELMGEKLDDEVYMLESLAPSVGFFTYGEYFHAGKIVELLNVTTTFIALSETKKVEEKRLKPHPKHHYDEMRRALTHLIKVTNQELEHVSTHDLLTGLYNRMEYVNVVERKIKSAKRYNEHFGLLLIDIDFFKLINDEYGHTVGDRVLKRFAETLRESIREDDFIARWGGEEFIIIANYAKEKELEVLAKKLQKKIAKSSFEPVSRVTASFGLTTYRDGDNSDTLFKRVDNALYKAKQNGRDRYEIS